VLVGASDVKQLDADLAAAALEIDDDLAADLDDVSAVEAIYPRWWDEAMGLA
jgi:aryl-alcohol dehydrogenase-like predicted oxidoreductase